FDVPQMATARRTIGLTYATGLIQVHRQRDQWCKCPVSSGFLDNATGTSLAEQTPIMNNTYTPSVPVAGLDENSRGRFVARAYNHLFGAVTAFVLFEVLLFKTLAAEAIAQTLLGFPWLAVIG